MASARKRFALSRWRPLSAIRREGSAAISSRAIRDEARFVGWRTGGRVVAPPKDAGGPGDWVAIGPGAVLEAYAPAEWLADIGNVAEDGSYLALVTLDGADTAMLARLRPVPGVDGSPIGTRVSLASRTSGSALGGFLVRAGVMTERVAIAGWGSRVDTGEPIDPRRA